MIRMTKTIWIVVGILYGVGWVQASVAREVKAVYPGSACQNTYAEDASGTYRSQGQIMNMSESKSIRFTCPIVHNANNFYTATAWVYDAHPEQDIECKIIMASGDGVKYNLTDKEKAGLTSSSKGSPDKPQELRLHPGLITGVLQEPDTIPEASISSYYSLECTLPPLYKDQRSRILSYLVYELERLTPATEQE